MFSTNASIGQAPKSFQFCNPPVYLEGLPNQTHNQSELSSKGSEFSVALADWEEEGMMIYGDCLKPEIGGGFGGGNSFLNEDGGGSSIPRQKYQFHEENGNIGSDMIVPPGASEVKIIDSNYYTVMAMTNGIGGFQNQGKKRIARESGMNFLVENSMERRQKRKIKNRESAARSRARKQAYNSQLELEIVKLKQENVRLKKEMLLGKIAAATPVQPAQVLRRTYSSHL